MRWLIVLVVLVVGCVATLPSDDVTVSADLAAEAARMVVQLRQEIHPNPTPVSDRCENCNGTGKIGDGRIVMKCPTCGGTGKR
jgi:Zn finger protein HypA/HybF involved in hydrogenase expression